MHDIKKLFAVGVLSISTIVWAQQKEATYTSESTLGRTEACSQARASAQLYSKNELSCLNPSIAIGSCDCEVANETSVTVKRHKCLVVAKIACAEKPEPAAPRDRQETRSFSSTTVAGGTRAEGCATAKTNAEFWSGLNGFRIVGFSACDCSEQRKDTLLGPEVRWTCGVDAALRPR